MGYSPMEYMNFLGTGTHRVGTSAELIVLPAGTRAVLISAGSANAGDIFVGNSAVTNTVGADNQTTGLQVDAGRQTPWLPIPVGGLYAIGSAVDQDLTFIAVGAADA